MASGPTRRLQSRLGRRGDRKLDTIKPAEVQKWANGFRSEVENRTIVRYLTVMHSVFKHARVIDNPASADNVVYPKVEYTGKYVHYRRDEVDELVSAAGDDGPIILVAALTGLRQGELLALRWGCVDFYAGLVRVERSYSKDGEKVPKGAKDRSVPMAPDVVDVFAKLKERGYMTDDEDLVFCNTAGDHLDSWALRRRYYRAIKRAGLRRIRFHDLRHTFATGAIETLPPAAVQGYMGHAHYVTTQRYIRRRPQAEDAAKLAEAFRVPNRVPKPPNSDRTGSNSTDPIPQ